MSQFVMGDMVFAALDLFNEPLAETGESGIPGLAPGTLLAHAGARGVVVNVGHAEAAPDQEIYLVRFESGADGVLAEPIGCLAEELCGTPLGKPVG
ncbi:MAG: nitrogen fixation protein NifZ [Gallionellales bacterium RIFOXYB12_FULL_54_9]|nr:MAG: nitrogen fixation protein NifZ [Gallionellales bacterium RIFOXYB12_FULL_54_9]